MTISSLQPVQFPDGRFHATVASGKGCEDAEASEWTERETAYGWTYERADAAGLDIVDIPAPCPECGGIAFWFDLAGGAHCEACSPPKSSTKSLRERAAESHQLHSVTRTPDHQPSTVRVPSEIIADPIPICRDCQRRPVVSGQPGRPAGLCYECWTLEQARKAAVDRAAAVTVPTCRGKQARSSVTPTRGHQRGTCRSRRLVASAAT
jgi:hypothetical protein